MLRQTHRCGDNLARMQLAYLLPALRRQQGMIRRRGEAAPGAGCEREHRLDAGRPNALDDEWAYLLTAVHRQDAVSGLNITDRHELSGDGVHQTCGTDNTLA